MLVTKHCFPSLSFSSWRYFPVTDLIKRNSSSHLSFPLDLLSLTVLEISQQFIFYENNVFLHTLHPFCLLSSCI